MQGLGRAQGVLELEDVRSIEFCPSFPQALKQALCNSGKIPRSLCPHLTALPTERKRHRFCLIFKKKSRCLGGIWFLIRQWSGCPGKVVGSCCIMCCAGEDCQVDSELIPPSCRLVGWSIILISFLKISFLTVPNMAFWKKKKVFILPPTILYVLNRRKTKMKATTKPKVAIFETACVYCTWQKTAPSFP